MSKKTDWGKVVRETVNDIICAIKTPSSKPKQPNCPNPKARICILILIGIIVIGGTILSIPVSLILNGFMFFARLIFGIF